MSARPGLTEKRLSSHRFQQIPDNMKNPNDVTIDIPLTNVSSRGQTGARNNGNNIPSPGYAAGAETGNPNGTEKGGLTSSPPSSQGFGHRRRLPITGEKGRTADDPEDGTITRLGRFYQAILNFSPVTRYMIYILPLGILLAIPIIVGATAAEDAAIGGVWLPWFFAWFEVLWVSLWVCKLAAKIIPYVFQFICGIVSSGTRKYALVLRNLETPLTMVLWLVVSVVTFFPVSQLHLTQLRPANQADHGVQPEE